MKRRIALSVLVLVVVALAVTMAACGSGDPYSGTWRDPGDDTTTWVITKANNGWWSIDNGPKGSPSIIYAAEVNDRLETGNAYMTFTADGDKLQVSFRPGATKVDLVRQ